jgi:hypothetical protein
MNAGDFFIGLVLALFAGIAGLFYLPSAITIVLAAVLLCVDALCDAIKEGGKK